MSIKRYGVEGGTGTGGQHLVRAGGGSGRLAVRFRPDADENGEVVEGGLSTSRVWRFRTA